MAEGVTGIEDIDRRTRAYIYDHIFSQGRVPLIAEIAAGMGCEPDVALASVRRLAQGHSVVLQDGRDEILMASPFSAVPTLFQVEAGAHTYWGNCIWDALGALAMLKADGRVVTSCGDCNAAMTLTVRAGALVETEGVAHFAIPAKQWWDDIVFT